MEIRISHVLNRVNGIGSLFPHLLQDIVPSAQGLAQQILLKLRY
jgi:hypothetical protein